MNKMSIISIVLSLVVICNSSNLSAGIDEENALPSYKIYLTNYYKSDPIRDKLPIIEYDGQNGYSIYKTETYVTDKKNESIRLSLSKDNKPILLKFADKDYYTNLFNTIYYAPSPYFIGDDSLEFITLVAFLPEKKINEYETDCAVEAKYFPKDSLKVCKRSIWGGNNTKITQGAICYIDSSYNVEWRELKNGSLVVTKREAINPDDYRLNINKIPGLKNTNSIYYYPSCKFGNGFVRMKPGSDLYYLNGQQYDFNPNTDKLIPILIKNNTTFIDFHFLLGLLNCQYMTGSTDNYIGQRLYKDKQNNKISILSIDLSADKRAYSVCDDEKEFTIAPYWLYQHGSLMVPLKEVCEALQAKVIYRPHDGTILISRFFEY